MSTAPLDIEGVVKASELDRERRADREIEWEPELLEGRLGELSSANGAASTTYAFALVRAYHQSGEPVAWVTDRESAFFGPDVAHNGVDLEALPVVRVGDLQTAARAADRLLRSGGFGLVVLDVTEMAGPGASPDRPLQKRLVRHAEAHEATVLFMTDKDPEAPSIGALSSFRVQSERTRGGGDRFTCRLEALADKRHGPGWDHEEEYRGPPGLR